MATTVISAFNRKNLQRICFSDELFLIGWIVFQSEIYVMSKPCLYSYMMLFSNTMQQCFKIIIIQR